MAQQTCNSFEPTTNTSSASICKWCGQEKFLHALKVNHMPQQTAVDWLFNKLLLMNPNLLRYGGYLEQAKQMDKQQKMDAYGVGHNDGCSYMIDGKTEFKNAEQYYNRTFKSE